MKIKKSLPILLILLCAALLLVFTATACGKDEEPETGKIIVSFYTTSKTSPVVASYKQENLTAGSAFLSLIPSRMGYTFCGLYDSETGGIQVVNEFGILNVSITKNATLYARWTGQDCTIELLPGDGTLPEYEKGITVTWGGLTPQLPVPTREGYDFIGWYGGADIALTDENGSPLHNAKNLNENFPVTLKNNRLVLTAYYKIKKLTLTLDFNDGTYKTTVLSYDYGTSPDTDDFPKRDEAGRELVGWSLSRTANEPFSGRLTEDTTLYAVWRDYRVIYFYILPDDENPTSLRVYRDADAVSMDDPQRGGYRFCGWYNNKLYSGNPTDSFSYGSAYDTYYAKWELETYRITFTSDSGESFPDINYTVLSDPIPLPTCSKEDYEFLGWCTDRNGKGTIYRTLPSGHFGNLDFYAIFRSVERRVVLDPGNGTLSETVATVRYGEDFTLPVPTPADSGYVFAGWYLGTGEAITDASGNGLTAWSYTDDETRLVAHYSKKYYVRVTPSIDGAASYEVGDYYADGQSFEIRAKVKAGYTFVGWYIGGTKVGESEVFRSRIEQADVYIELRVAPGTYRIRLNPGNDAFCKSTDATVTFGESYRLPVPYRQGYKFLYWQIDADGISDAVTITDENGNSLGTYTRTSDITVSAVYEKSDDNEILIRNKNDFLAIKNKPDGHYVLISDIDMSGASWVPFDFSGIIRGNGYVIKNLTLSSDSGNLGVFLRLSGTLSDISFENLTVTSTSYTQVLVGGVCAELTGTMAA